MRLKFKIPLILFAAYCVIVGLLIAFTLFNSAKVHKESQYGTTTETAKSHVEAVDGFLSARVAEIKSLERIVTLDRHLSDDDKLEMLHKHMYNYLSESDSKLISDLYVFFERGAYFSEAATEEGRYFNIDCFRSEKGTLELSDEPSESVADDDDWYLVPKRTGKLHLTEPYKWTYPEEKNERPMITLSSPLFFDGKFAGVVGMDIEIEMLQKEFFDHLTNEKSGTYSNLVSNGGLRVSHPNPKMWLTEIGNDLPADEQKKLQEAIRAGKEYMVVKTNNLTGETSIIPFVPVSPKWLDLPWSINHVVPLSYLRKDEIKVRNISIAIGFASAVFWGLFLMWLMSNVFGGLTSTVSALSKMTEGDGDLTIRLEEKGKDEIGQMAKGLNSLIEKLHSTIKTTQKEAKKLLGQSSTLFGVSQNLYKVSETSLEHSKSTLSATESASQSAKAIAGEAERTSQNANELASAAEQMSANMNSVAGAVEELSASFAQITGSTDESHAIATEAVEKATEATGAMNKLGVAAREIGQVTDVIKKIADKTNLLALNATIEAASAGDSGKGFAVVAGEIKELANQSAKSADDIASRIDGIQSGTSNAITVISKVAEIISKINISVDSIASSVGQQTKASNEIANNVAQANVGAKRVSGAISEIAGSVRDSAQNASNVANSAQSASKSVESVHEDSKKINSSSSELEKAADELKFMAESLDSIVSKFKT